MARLVPTIHGLFETPPSLRAKRSNPETAKSKAGLLRRFAPRNDETWMAGSGPAMALLYALANPRLLIKTYLIRPFSL
jgi:hypothetical protein